MVISLIQPKLGLSEKTDASVNEYALQIINNLDLYKSTFPDVDLDALKASQVAYENALSKVKHGTPADTAFKNNKRMELQNELRKAAFVCAETANGDEAMFLLSGFQIRSKPTPSGQLSAPSSFDLMVSSMEGTLVAKFKSVKHAYVYELQYGPQNSDTTQWSNMTVTTAGKYVISELQSNVYYSVRVRAIGVKGKKSEWSEIVTRKTY